MGGKVTSLADLARQFLTEDQQRAAEQKSEKQSQFETETVAGTKSAVPQVVKPSVTGKVYSGLAGAAKSFFEEQPTPAMKEARSEAKPAPEPEPVKSEAQIQSESPFKFKPMAKPESISEASENVGKALVQLEPPDHPSPHQAYWEHEYAARTRDLQKLAGAATKQKQEQADQEQQEQ